MIVVEFPGKKKKETKNNIIYYLDNIVRIKMRSVGGRRRKYRGEVGGGKYRSARDLKKLNNPSRLVKSNFFIIIIIINIVV